MGIDDGTHSLSTQGDSGGGLFNQAGQVTAITIDGGLRPEDPDHGHTYYADLSTPSNQQFIRDHLPQNAGPAPMEVE